MTPRETRFLKVLVESSVISADEAERLGHVREKRRSETGEHVLVWDAAVEEGIVTRAQAERFLERSNGDEEEYNTRNLAASQSQVEQAAASGARKLGNYELISKLGQGGMGAVYKARQASMDRTVAIKVLPRNLARNEDFIARFLREARAAGRLSHPNIVTGIDAGFADGYYYFAMEYVEGRSLGDRLKDGPLAEPEVVHLGRQVASALDHAHGAGIVHRDVKPENVLISDKGQAKLCDLGLARSAHEDLRITQAGMAVGTPFYISPEQIRGKEPGPHADIYSLGCTLYHLASGQPPFEGENAMAVMQRHLNETPRRLREVRSELSPALEAVIHKMMAREVAKRYRDAAEVAGDLERVGSGRIPSALGSAVAERRGGTRRRRGTTRTRDTAATAPVTATGSRWRLMAGAATGLVVLGALLAAGLIWWFRADWQPDGNDTPTANSPGAVSPNEKTRLAALGEELDYLQGYEKQNPGEYGKLITRYGEFLAKAEGSEYAAKAAAALAAVKERRNRDRSAERLKKLASDLEAVESYAAKQPENYDGIAARYERFLAGAAGTEFESRARAALEASISRRKTRTGELLAELRSEVKAATASGALGDALARISAFPQAYAPVAKAELAELDSGVRAAGRERWEAIQKAAGELSAAKRFDEAEKKAAEVRGLGLPELGKELAAVRASIGEARRKHEAELASASEKKYRKFSDGFSELAREGRFDDLLAAGEALRGKLSPEIEKELAVDLELAGGAGELMKGIEKLLSKAKPGSFRTPLPMGVKGKFRGYNARTGGIDFEFGPGTTTLKLADFRGRALVRLARDAAGGELDPAAARSAACYLLALGERAPAGKLLAAAKAGGQDVGALEERLSGAAESAARRAWEKGPGKLLGEKYAEKEARALIAALDAFAAAHGKTRFAASKGEEIGRHSALAEAALATSSPSPGSCPLPAGLQLGRRYEIKFAQGAAIPVLGIKEYCGILDTSLSLKDPNLAGPERGTGGAGSLCLGFKKREGKVRHAVIRIDLAAIPRNARIERVVLSMHCRTGAKGKLAVYRVTSPWQPSVKSFEWNAGASWTYASGSGKDRKPWKMPGGDFDSETNWGQGANGLVCAPVAWRWTERIEFDLTSIARAWISGKVPNYGVLLKPVDWPEKEAGYLHSADSDDPETRPEFTITFTVPAG